jgi:hypothetical protein
MIPEAGNGFPGSNFIWKNGKNILSAIEIYKNRLKV